MYDLIGDVHGYATPLKDLLRRLEYVEIDGIWQHPERQVIFLGDFVDRGPEQLETVRVARAMAEAGKALAVMGNHEFNAVAWATPDPANPDSFLRPHSDKNLKQHASFLQQIGEGSQAHREMIEWFKTLPLYLDLDGLRVIHACWHPEHLETLAQHTDDRNRILAQSWPALTRKGTSAYEALETVLKGLEIPLPAGVDFPDKEGHRRHDIRVKWWDLESTTYHALAMVPPGSQDAIPHDPIPGRFLPGYDQKKPLFLGHYWMTGTPAPLNKHIACLDYSIAGGNLKSGKSAGKLCSYRWHGENALDPANFIWVTE